jgi:cytochrome c5
VIIHSFPFIIQKTKAMTEVILLFALLAVVISAALFLKSRVRGGSGKKFMSVLVIVFSIALFAACGGDKPENGKDTDTILSTDKYTIYITKEDIDSIENAADDTVAIRMTRREYSGMHLFMVHCNKCHPGGDAGVGPSLNDKAIPDFLVHFQIRQGLGDMPAFKEEDLSKEDVKKIVLFVRQMREEYKAEH